MNTGGYSRKSLIDKLGYKMDETIYLYNSPKEFQDYLKSEHINEVNTLPATWTHAFFKSHTAFAAFLSQTNLSKIEKGLWVSWPKRSSKVETDLTEQTFRDKILPLGWVDIKVTTIDETWSGLKFARRKNN